MSKSIIISERDNIAAVVQDGKVMEFFIHRGDILLGDVYLASVENILPSIDAAFVNVGSDKMGFLHASDVVGKGALKDKLTPKQKLIVQVIKEPTGHKGPRVTTSLSLPGRFLVLMPDEKGISISRKISSAKERARLKSIVSLLKPAGVGVIIRTEAEGQSEAEIQEDLELLLEKWNNIITAADTVTPPNLIHRDQDLLYRVIREVCNEGVEEIILDTSFGMHRANQLLQSWNMSGNIKVSVHKGTDSILIAKGIDKEIRAALQTKVNLPSGGYLYIQTTEALTVIDVNSGKFTSSATQSETIRKTNLEAITEIARQLRLRNIGGMIIIDFIDMENRVDKLSILEELELALEPDKAKPQVGQLSDLGLVELTRHRQGQSLAEIFTKKCPACAGTGAVIEDFNFVSSTQEGDFRAKANKIKLPAQQKAAQSQALNGNQNQSATANKVNGNKNVNLIQQPKPSISTTPSVIAAQLDNKRKPKAEPQHVEITEDKIKAYIATKGYVPNISKFVCFASVSPEIANKHLTSAYKKSVFTILQEIEASEAIMSEQVNVQNQPEAALQVDETQPVVNEVQEVSEVSPSAEPVQTAQLVLDTPETETEIQPFEEVQESEEVKQEETETPESQEEQAVEEKPKKRGRKPGSTTAKKSTSTRKRTTTRKKTTSTEEE